MKETAQLTTASLLTMLLLMVHLTDDIVRGFEPGGPKTLTGVLILVVWLCGTLLLRGRLLGYVIMLLGSLLGSGVPYLHMRGAGMVGGRIANTDGMFFWVFTLIALGTTAWFAVILSARALWTRQWQRESR